MRTDAPIPGPDRFLRFAILIGAASFLCGLISFNFVDIDIWHQMALVRESVPSGHLLKSDPYAYTPTSNPWIDHEWGAGVIAYFSTAWFGSRAILVLKLVAALGTAFLCVQCSKIRGADLRVLGACAPVAILLAYLGFFAVIRAQAYSFFFMAALLLFWEFGRRGRRYWIFAWLAIFALWVNLHAGFIVAIALTGLHLVEEFLRKNPVRYLWLLLVGMLAEVFLNPYGIAYFGYLRRALMMSRPYAPEWGPVYGLGTASIIAFVVSVLLLLYAVASLGLRHTPGVLPLIATLVEAALHRKLLPFFALTWICYVPAYLQRTPAGERFLQLMQKKRRFVLILWTTFACVCILAAAENKPWNLAVPQPIYPVGPVDYLARNKFAGNLLVPFRLGAYASWKLFPLVKVSLDSRYEETYPDSVMRDVFAFYEARPGWRAALEAYPTDAALVPKEAPTSRAMRETNWIRTYTDQQFEIYVRPGITLPVEDRSSSSFNGVFP